MKSFSRRVTSLFLSVLMIFTLFGCSKASVPTATAGEEVAPTVSTPGETIPPETETKEPTLPEFMNPLTGLACDPSLVGQRPLAVMINNIKPSLPQSGLDQCDIIYEVLAEGGIIRLEGLILDYQNAGVIGTVRSSRPYYIEIATAYDALYAHCGGSTQAYANISRLGIENIDAMVYTGQIINGEEVYWRDQDRLNNGVSAEHTLFGSGKGIYEVVKARRYRTTLNDAEFTAFCFDPAFQGIEGGSSATYIKIPHSYYSVSEFRYMEDQDLYFHSQYGEAHVDGATGNQVGVTNLFLIYADLGQIAGDSKGRLWVDLVGEGEGVYCNGGESVAITWKRESETGAFSYYLKDGSELKVEPGKSYVSVVESKTAPSVTIS